MVRPRLDDGSAKPENLRSDDPSKRSAAAWFGGPASGLELAGFGLESAATSAVSLGGRFVA